MARVATPRENKHCFTERERNRLDLRPAVSWKPIETHNPAGESERNRMFRQSISDAAKPVLGLAIYSYLSATVGSMRIARRAGR
jgi:hypothetical protein